MKLTLSGARACRFNWFTNACGKSIATTGNSQDIDPSHYAAGANSTTWSSTAAISVAAPEQTAHLV